MLPEADRILVVDDDQAILYVLKETLYRDGYQVEVVDCGEQAMKLVDEQPFELALVDLKLKGMNGLELISFIRQKMPEIAIIVFTAHASLESAVEALRLGAVDYLLKPCKTEDLRTSIRRAQLVSRQKQQQKTLIFQMKQLLDQINEENVIGADSDVLGFSYDVDSNKMKTITPPKQNQRFLRRGLFSIDFQRHVITIDGQMVELSPTEYNLLVYLISEAPRVISSAELVREVQGYHSESWGGYDTVRFHIYRIRQKIKMATGHDKVILTIRGIGYSINERIIE